MIQGFKSAATKRVNILRGTPGASLWQRGYYEHVIRNEDDLQRTREYVVHNAATWLEDEYHPAGL